MGWTDQVPQRRHVWVLSGGGARGAAQAGAISALIEAGVRPVALVGCSVGALNAAFIAGGADLERAATLEERWLAIGRSDVLGGSRLAGVRNVMARRTALFSHQPLSRLIETWLPAATFEELAVRLRVVTTVLSTGQPAHHERGRLHPVLLASAALPGLFPPVALPVAQPVAVPVAPPKALPIGLPVPIQRRRGPTLVPGTELHVDGGISQIIPLGAATTCNPTDVWVLDVAAPAGTGHWRARSALGVLGASVTASMRARPAPPWEGVTVHHLALRAQNNRLTSVMDFSRSAELIEFGRSVACQALDEYSRRQPVPVAR